MIDVLVLGGHGMLGSMVARVLGENPELRVATTVRPEDPGASVPATHAFDASTDSLGELLDAADPTWIVNAIGAIKPRIDERDPASMARAVDVNAAFPYRLAAEARAGRRVIQIATDCVYSGAVGDYDEGALHDPLDVYGKTKSLGEAPAAGFLHLRCSIIGPELREPPSSLLGWLLSQPREAEVKGFTNHRWNGVTTWHFAKLCEAVILGELDDLPSPLHVTPGDAVTKAELLELALEAFDRADVTVSPQPAEAAIDRTLATVHPQANERLWAAAGYAAPPTVKAMLGELAARAQDLAAAR